MGGELFNHKNHWRVARSPVSKETNTPELTQHAWWHRYEGHLDGGWRMFSSCALNPMQSDRCTTSCQEFHSPSKTISLADGIFWRLRHQKCSYNYSRSWCDSVCQCQGQDMIINGKTTMMNLLWVDSRNLIYGPNQQHVTTASAGWDLSGSAAVASGQPFAPVQIQVVLSSTVRLLVQPTYRNSFQALVSLVASFNQNRTVWHPTD